MALIKCLDCQKEISDNAPACIHCGCPTSAQGENNSAGSDSFVDSAMKPTKVSKSKKIAEKISIIFGIVVVIIAIPLVIFALVDWDGFEGFAESVFGTEQISYIESNDEEDIFFAVGDVVPGNNWSVHLVSFEIVRIIRDDVFTFEPNDGDRFVVVRLTVRNESNQASDFLPYWWFDKEGEFFLFDESENIFSYEPFTSMFGYSEHIQFVATDINPGSHVTGNMVFSVNERAARSALGLALFHGTDNAVYFRLER